jgi:hypothetical protein
LRFEAEHSGRRQFYKVKMDKKTLKRFWDKVEILGKDDCWEWKASLRAGYGTIRINGIQESSHRVSWKIHHGNIPKGIFVCHSCDNKLCVNPNHLWLGTYLDNIRDMVNKKRNNPIWLWTKNHPEVFPRGEKARLAKLTNKDAYEIRKLFNDNKYNQTKLANIYKVSKWVIFRVVHNMSYIE